MGYTKYTGSDEAQYQYIVDTDSDIENLPTSAKGSMAMSIESGKFYALNSNNEWASVGAGSSGGGGGGSFLVTITWDDTTSKYVCDKTYAEIKAAFESGQAVVAFSDPNVYELVQVDSGFIRFASNDFDFASSTNTLILLSDTFKVLSDGSVTEDYINVKWTVTDNS